MLYVLADGMGGHIGGAQASRIVSMGILESFSGVSISDPLKQLRKAMDDANSLLTDRLREEPQLNGMGTTLITVLQKISTGEYWFLSVGDSPLYRFNKQTGLHRINQNHAYYEELLEQVRKGKITHQQADTDPQRNAITSALMGKEIPHVDTNSGQLGDGDCLLMASDGVQTLDDTQNGELANILSETQPLEKYVSRILQAVEAAANPYQDNTTLILISAGSSLSATTDRSRVPQASAEGMEFKTIPKTERITKKTENKSKKTPVWLISLLVVLILTILFLLSYIYFTVFANVEMTEPDTAEATEMTDAGNVGASPVTETESSKELENQDSLLTGQVPGTSDMAEEAEKAVPETGESGTQPTAAEPAAVSRPEENDSSVVETPESVLSDVVKP